MDAVCSAVADAGRVLKIGAWCLVFGVCAGDFFGVWGLGFGASFQCSPKFKSLLMPTLIAGRAVCNDTASPESSCTRWSHKWGRPRGRRYPVTAPNAKTRLWFGRP